LKQRASGYVHKPLAGPENIFLDMSLFLGSGSVYSTVGDLLLFDQALHGGQLLSDDSLDRMIRSGLLGGASTFPTKTDRWMHLATAVPLSASIATCVD
jgi:hypothetical protein